MKEVGVSGGYAGDADSRKADFWRVVNENGVERWGAFQYEILSFLGEGASSSVWLLKRIQRARKGKVDVDADEGKLYAGKFEVKDDDTRDTEPLFLENGEILFETKWEKRDREIELLKLLSGVYNRGYGGGEVTSRVSQLREVIRFKTPNDESEGRLIVTDFVPTQSFVYDDELQGYFLHSHHHRHSRALLNEAGVRWLASELLSAVNELSQKNIFHRDIKPENFGFTRKLPASFIRPLSPTVFPGDDSSKSSDHLAQDSTRLLEVCAEKTVCAVEAFDGERSRGLSKREKEMLGRCLFWPTSPNFEADSSEVPRPLPGISAEDSVSVRLIDFDRALCSPRGVLWDAAGTTAFTPPEALIKPPGGVYDGTARDLFSVGVVLYLSAFGALPFNDCLALKLQCLILRGEFALPPSPPWLGSFALSDVMTETIRLLLSKNPKDRLQCFYSHTRPEKLSQPMPVPPDSTDLTRELSRIDLATTATTRADESANEAEDECADDERLSENRINPEHLHDKQHPLKL